MFRSRMGVLSFTKGEGNGMSDIREFLDSYQETLSMTIDFSGWPPELLSIYMFESCLKHTDDKQVYLVVDQRTGGKAVLRVTTLDSTDRADAEWEILAKLDHPGIPKVFGEFVTAEKKFIIREYVHGQSLDAVVAQKLMSPQEALTIAKQLCEILGYIHTQSPPVIHRDIKPQNIILKPDGDIVLTDFEIARTFKPGAYSDTQYAGTLPYAPPEQYGYAQSTPQTDIYALGIVLIYLVTGSPDRQNLAAKIGDQRLLEVINRCIAFDPDARFASAEEVLRSAQSKVSRKTKITIAVISSGIVLLLVLAGAFIVFDPLDLKIGALVSGTADNSGAVYDSSVGNTGGNIVSGGLAVDGGGEIFLARSDGIYTVGKDGNLDRRAVAAAGPGYLNYYKGKLYFRAGGQLLSADPQTGDLGVVYKNGVGKVFISEGVLYFENTVESGKLYAIDFDGSNARVASDYDNLYYRNVYGGYDLFANKDDDECLYRINLETGEAEKIYDQRSAWMSVYEGKIYFSDFIDNDFLSMDLDGGNQETLHSDAASHVNACSHGLFYLNGDGLQLEKMTHEGLRGVIVPKKCGSFHVTSEWIFYENADEDDELWMCRIDGSDDRVVPNA